jgi:hypothetical protein
LNAYPGAVTRPAAPMSAPVIVETPVVASDCVSAVAISLKLELSSDDLINPPGTKAAIGKLYVPLELLGMAASYFAGGETYNLCCPSLVTVGGAWLPLIAFMSAIVLGDVPNR